MTVEANSLSLLSYMLGEKQGSGEVQVLLTWLPLKLAVDLFIDPDSIIKPTELTSIQLVNYEYDDSPSRLGAFQLRPRRGFIVPPLMLPPLELLVPNTPDPHAVIHSVHLEIEASRKKDRDMIKQISVSDFNEIQYAAWLSYVSLPLLAAASIRMIGKGDIPSLDSPGKGINIGWFNYFYHRQFPDYETSIKQHNFLKGFTYFFQQIQQRGRELYPDGDFYGEPETPNQARELYRLFGENLPIATASRLITAADGTFAGGLVAVPSGFDDSCNQIQLISDVLRHQAQTLERYIPHRFNRRYFKKAYTQCGFEAPAPSYIDEVSRVFEVWIADRLVEYFVDIGESQSIL